MTNLNALRSLTEFYNANLFEKTLLDNGVTGGDTYAAADEQSIDLCLADVYFYMATHPEFREGQLAFKYSADVLLRMRRAIYDKWGLDLPEQDNSTGRVQITGKPVAIGSTKYSVW